MGYTVVGIDSFEDYYARELKEANLRAVRENRRFELVEANVLDLAGLGSSRQPMTLGGLVADVDYVFHLAAQAGVRASWGTASGSTPRTTFSRRRRCWRLAARPI